MIIARERVQAERVDCVCEKCSQPFRAYVVEGVESEIRPKGWSQDLPKRCPKCKARNWNTKSTVGRPRKAS